MTAPTGRPSEMRNLAPDEPPRPVGRRRHRHLLTLQRTLLNHSLLYLNKHFSHILMDENMPVTMVTLTTPHDARTKPSNSGAKITQPCLNILCWTASAATNTYVTDIILPTNSLLKSQKRCNYLCNVKPWICKTLLLNSNSSYMTRVPLTHHYSKILLYRTF